MTSLRRISSMTKVEYNNVFNKVMTKTDMHNALVFQWDPICEVIEHREIYSPNRIEVVMWMEEIIKSYKKLDIEFVCYIDGEYISSNGVLHTKFEEG
jgi:hypothetical protein